VHITETNLMQNKLINPLKNFVINGSYEL